MKKEPLARIIGRGLARLSYSYFVEPVWLQTNRVDLPFPAIDPAIRDLKIVQLSDFHLGAQVPASHVRQAVELARRQGADLIALTGDFIHSGFRHIEAIASLLGRLEAPLGLYAVLGNHDYNVRNLMKLRFRSATRLPAMITEALESVGIRVLDNEHVTLERHGRRFAVAGVGDQWSGRADLPKALDAIPPDMPRIVLAHNPVSLEKAGSRRCDLVLSGHTHGGQIMMPGRGSPMLSKRMRNVASGLYRHATGYLYVNKGVGYTVRLRYNARPEIAVLTFREGKLETL